MVRWSALAGLVLASASCVRPPPTQAVAPPTSQQTAAETVEIDRDRQKIVAQDRAGGVVWATTLPVKNFDPQPVRELLGLFLVQRWDSPGGLGEALLIDRAGQVWHRFDRQIVDGAWDGQNRVFVTSRDVRSLGPRGQVLWTTPFKRREWIAGGGLLDLPGGDRLAFVYGLISDSGAQVMRVKPATGEVVWQSWCAGLGVRHSSYEHRVTVSMRDGAVIVESVGSAGRFVETLGAATGKQLARHAVEDEG